MIVGQRVTQAANDKEQVRPMMEVLEPIEPIEPLERDMANRQEAVANYAGMTHQAEEERHFRQIQA